MNKNDKVKCINHRDSNSLLLDKTYTVEDVNQYGNIQVRETFDEKRVLAHYYKPERFEMVLARKSKIDLSKKYKTREGKEVKLLAFSDDRSYPLLGQIKLDGVWTNETWTFDGQFSQDSGPSKYDLVEVIEKIELKFSGRNLQLTIREDLVVEVCDGSGQRVATLVPEVMDELMEAYNRMKQCKN